MIDGRKLTRWYDFQAPFYRLWRDDYDSSLVARAALALGSAAGQLRILDAGCGTGMFTIGIARMRPGWSLEGLDASSGMLAVARRQVRKLGIGNVTFRSGDVMALPYDAGQFDGAIAAGLFPNVDDPRRALDELYRVVRDSGRVVIVEFDREAMRTLTRLFFHAMILGYKLFSGVVRRFRFAERWSVEASTIERAVFERHCLAAGFRAVEIQRREEHLIFELAKEPR
jgi:ubiquinone/menaquinone biosynthesis C-methylase UbiE